jgi:hypothetical protein
MGHAGHTMSTIAEGVVDLEDIRRHLAEEERDGGLTYAELIDARTAVPSLSPADVRMLVTMLRDLAADHVLGRTAVLVSTDYAYGLMRMLELLVEDVCTVRPFRALADAEAWLRDTGPAAGA